MRARSFLMAAIVFACVAYPASLWAAKGDAPTAVSPAVESVQKSAENQIRRLVEPLLEKYCREQCKLLSVNVSVDVSVPEQMAPGFDDIASIGRDALAPTSARMKLLIDDQVGPVSRGKLVDLVQQYLDTLDYPVNIDVQLAHFPQPIESEGKIIELRDRLAKSFQSTVNELIRNFCPEHCMLADFDLKTEVVNAEEAQYGSPGEFVQEGGVALRVRRISGTLLIDESLNPEERNNIIEMVKLKTNSFKNVELTPKTLKFPRPASSLYADGVVDGGTAIVRRGPNGERLASERKDSTSSNSSSSESKQLQQSSENKSSSTQTQSNNNAVSQNKNTTQSTETNQRQERYERLEKIERVENGDAVQQELKNFKLYALIFGCSILALLIFIAAATFRHRIMAQNTVQHAARGPIGDALPMSAAVSETGEVETGDAVNRAAAMNMRYEILRLMDELVSVFAQHPRVARHVFGRIITEEGIEVTAQYLHIFGESIVAEILRDPSLQSDMNELMEYYARTNIDLKDQERYDLLRRLHQRTVSGKLAVMGNRSSSLFDFLGEMDGTQILEMIRNESLTVKAIILTQCDSQKRSAIYAQLDEDTRMRLLTELSRIDYLPRDYIFNVANALKRKRRENPRLNTEALPGSEVLVSLLERTGTSMQRDVVKSLEASNPDSARTVKGKLVSIETLRYLRDGQLLEVVLSLRHDELLVFLKACPPTVKDAVFAKSPKELVLELDDELVNLPQPNREAYLAVERKILNRMKLMANDGLINLVETNDRMFSESTGEMTGAGQQGAPIVGVISLTGRKAG